MKACPALGKPSGKWLTALRFIFPPGLPKAGQAFTNAGTFLVVRGAVFARPIYCPHLRIPLFRCLRGFGAPPGGKANIPLTNNAKAD